MRLNEIVGNDFLDIYEASGDGILILDPNAEILYCNDIWVELCAFNKFGYTKESMIGMDLNFFINSGIGVKAVALDAIKNKKKMTSLAYSLDNKAILTTATPFFNNNGTIKYVVAFVKDESEIQNLKSGTDNFDEIQNMYIDYLYHGKSGEKKIVMEDKSIRDIYVKALKICKTDATVLISGESGTGKDVLANFIHDNSNRSHGPFMAINCGAIPDNLVESEFFGYVRGAFTGANKEGKRGFFEAANNGTLFLDEIAELPISIQIKLLRVLETRKVLRVGGVVPVDVNVRIIAATNGELLEKVKNGTFRLDLYYRINVIKFVVPPLRERPKDIIGLVNIFIQQLNESYVDHKTISEDALEVLQKYEWPGNIRELRNTIENLMLTSAGNIIGYDDAKQLLTFERKSSTQPIVTVNDIAPLREVVTEAERQLLLLVSRSEHNSRCIAEILEIDQTTASRKLKKYGIDYK